MVYVLAGIVTVTVSGSRTMSIPTVIASTARITALNLIFPFYGVPLSVWAGEVYYGTKALFVSRNPIDTTILFGYYAWLGIHTSINCIPVGVRTTYPRVTRIFLSPPLFSIMATYSLYASTRVKGSYKLSVNNCSA